MIGAFGAAAVLITFGAVLGKCTILQLWVLATFEVIFYGLNHAVASGSLEAVDMGGAMYVHAFGAFFGLAASSFFHPKRATKDEMNRNGGSYYS